MKTTAERLGDTTVKLTVTVPAEDVDKAVDAAYRKVGGKVKLPGFRPGKAPRAVIDANVGRDYVLAEATEAIVNETYPRALDAESLRPIEPAEMDAIDNVRPGEEFTYEADVEVRPELTISSADDLSIELPPSEVTDAEIDEQIEQYRERFASLEPIEDRGVEMGDFVLLSFTGTVDGEAYEGNVVDKYLYESNRGLMPNEFDEGLVGLEPGAETRIEFAIPDTSSNPEFVGKTAGFDVTVHEIKAKVMPELDDEFAGNVGGFDTMDELRDALRAQLENQKSYAIESARERAVREAIAERLEGEIPEAMVRDKRDRLMRDFARSLEARDMSFEDYVQISGMDDAAVEADMTRQAEQGVREELALEALFRQLELEVTDEDIDEQLDVLSDRSKETPEQIRARWEEMGLMAVVREEIMHKKALEWLRDRVAVEVVEASDADEGTNPAEEDLPVQAGEFELDPSDAESEAAEDVADESDTEPDDAE